MIMKRDFDLGVLAVILIAMVGMSFVSCSKDDDNDDVNDRVTLDSFIVGTWENTYSLVYKTDGTGTSWTYPVYPGGSLSYEPRVFYNRVFDADVWIPFDYSRFQFVFQNNGTATLKGEIAFAFVYTYDYWYYTLNKTGKYYIIKNSVDFTDESINIKFDQNDSTLCVSVVDKMLAQERIGSHGVELWGDTAKYTAEIYFKKK